MSAPRTDDQRVTRAPTINSPGFGAADATAGEGAAGVACVPAGFPGAAAAGFVVAAAAGFLAAAAGFWATGSLLLDSANGSPNGSSDMARWPGERVREVRCWLPASGCCAVCLLRRVKSAGLAKRPEDERSRPGLMRQAAQQANTTETIDGQDEARASREEGRARLRFGWSDLPPAGGLSSLPRPWGSR